MSVFYFPSTTLCEMRQDWEEKSLKSQIWSFLYNKEGSLRTGDLPNPEEQIKLHEQNIHSIFSLVKIQKGYNF